MSGDGDGNVVEHHPETCARTVHERGAHTEPAKAPGLDEDVSVAVKLAYGALGANEAGFQDRVV